MAFHPVNQELPPTPPRWLGLTLVTMLLWGGWGLVSKPISDRLSSWQIQVVSAAGLLPVIGVLALSRKLAGGVNPRRGFRLAFLAGVIGSLGNVAYYQALAAGGKAAAVTPITALYPIATIALAVPLLRERLNPVQAAGALASLAALYFFNVGTDASWISPWLGLALVPILFWGVGALLQKCAANNASGELATLAFLAGELPASLTIPLLAPMQWTLPASTWGLAILLGLLFGVGNLTLIQAYGAGGKASVVTSMAALYSAVTIPLAILVLGERLTWREGGGILLALAAAVALSYEKPSAVTPPGSSH
jgi:transporter family protein